jgi:hypothetical protein
MLKQRITSCGSTSLAVYALYQSGLGLLGYLVALLMLGSMSLVFPPMG